MNSRSSCQGPLVTDASFLMGLALAKPLNDGVDVSSSVGSIISPCIVEYKLLVEASGSAHAFLTRSQAVRQVVDIHPLHPSRRSVCALKLVY
jgi:hypothetical protein